MNKKVYHIALRKRNCNDFFWDDSEYRFKEFCPKSKRYWIADPFLFECGGVYLFYEAMDRLSGKGVIAYSEIIDDCISEPRVIIREKFHLSFPYVFSIEGNIYLMPESANIDKICLYKAIDFPNKWERATLIDNIYACDTILLFDEKKDPISILTSEMFKIAPQGIIPSCYVKNRVYEFPNDLQSVADEGEVIAEGDCGIRSAGACFCFKGGQIRPGQDCTNGTYGKGIVFFRIDNIKPYKETEFFTLGIEELHGHLTRVKNSPLLGTHTYNLCNSYEVIDFSFMEEVPVIYCLTSFLLRVKKKIVWIFKNRRWN